MIKYIPHRGSLFDAIKEYREFDNIADMLIYIQQNSDGMVSANDIIIGESLGLDDRIGWKSTRHILTKKFGSECSDNPMCIGWCDLGERDVIINAFEMLKGYCKNRECNSKCLFYSELRFGNNRQDQFCGLCDIVTSDDKE